jgi:hypothetical protein
MSKKISIKQSILIDFMNGKSHTALSIAKKYDTTQGVRRVHELITEDEMPIQIRKEKSKSGHFFNVMSM